MIVIMSQPYVATVRHGIGCFEVVISSGSEFTESVVIIGKDVLLYRSEFALRGSSICVTAGNSYVLAVKTPMSKCLTTALIKGTVIAAIIAKRSI
jgi:hypothetical protein